MIAAIYAAEDAKVRLARIEEQVRNLTQLTDSMQQQTNSMQQQTSSSMQQQTSSFEDFHRRVDALTATTMALSKRISVEVDALSEERGALQTEAKTLKNEIQAVNQTVLSLRNEIMFQQRRLTHLATSTAAAGSHASHGYDGAADDIVNHRLDSLYVAFEDLFRGNREDIKVRFWPYIDRLEVAGAGQQDKPILDIGCGRGEWLELLRENGLYAYGIDLNRTMVEHNRSLDLDVRLGDAMEHLQSVEDASRSAVTAFRLVEHLPFTTLVDILDEVLRVLIPGGVLIVETPNPETIRVGATTFYYDPTHRNPIMPDALRFIIDHRGFTDAEIIRLNPFTQGLLQEKTADAELLNWVLFGPQDYAIVARRP